MNISAIKKAVRIVSYYSSSISEEDKIVKELLDPNNDILNNYLYPFCDELNINLLTLESANAKMDFIKFCVFEFIELQMFFKSNRKLLEDGYRSVDNTGKKFASSKDDREFEEIENYIVISYELIDMLFNEIALCCFKYKIDLYGICKELQFDHSFIDTSLYAHLVGRTDGKRNSTSGSGFQAYLKKDRKNLNSRLVKLYKNCKPESIAYMLFALVELHLLDKAVLTNKSKLHFVLVENFGRIGTRQNLNANINKLWNPDDYQINQIEVYKKEIQAVLRQK
ncbi:MAG TPA: hypothetical protein PK325_02835 [Cyclobacteriaceae bacterium]|nr:hypothetical protein [Cyclobacteriaceae bacterium]MBX7089939.1 hypothetical protein [Cyclobacteriaceae bacterium]HMV07551.1 hypothetical protein [Cyclobacteriaceae bacterium]HMV07561.1 hypothetical protein [Cyclobacteriaceae bacterium]HMV89049.1 hypothetical protein [Cyclobacteriaceae bacterium]